MFILNEEYTKRANTLIKNTLSPLDTLKLICEKRMSLSRFGDGEINMVTKEGKGCVFQMGSSELTSKLRDILICQSQDLLVAIPNLQMGGPWWKEYWEREFSVYSNYLRYDKVYGDAWVSRSPFFEKYRENGVKHWKDLWDGRKVAFITGEGGRFDCGHELFDNLADYDVIYGPPTQACNSIEQLIEKTKFQDKDTLFLIALGPAATILSYELCHLGFQAIDIGHITNCYDKVFKRGVQPEKLPLRGNVW